MDIAAMRQLARVLLVTSLVTMVSSLSGCTIGQELDPTEGRLRWILSTPDPCSCSNVHIGGVNPRPMKRPYEPVFTDELLRSRDALRSHFKCPNEDLNPCVLPDSTSPCQNGGNCHRDEANSGQFMCTCTVDYTGDFCQDHVWTLKETITNSDTQFKTNMQWLDNWADVGTTKVRVFLLRNEHPVVELLFDVKGSTREWFLQPNLIESPQWPSLMSATSDISVLELFDDEITVSATSTLSPTCPIQNGWMAIIARPTYSWLDYECAWMYGWDAPIVMLYSLNDAPLTWTDIVTEIPVSARTTSLSTPVAAPGVFGDSNCQTCFISGWQTDVWISFELNEPAEVGIVKLKNCPGSVTGQVSCPPFPSSHKTDYGDHCYHLSATAMHKEFAHEYCQRLSENGNTEWQVVEVDNAEENQQLNSLFQNSLGADTMGIWLGYALYNNGEWLAESDRSIQSYFNWANGPDAYPGPNCLFMNVGSSSPDGYWLTSECSSNRRVVCEYTGDFGKVSCPPVHSTYQTDSGDHCYLLSNTAMNKESAHRYCQSLSENGYTEWQVVEVDNAEENQQLNSLFQNSLGADTMGIWLGYASYNNGEWLAESDRSIQTYFNWANGPDAYPGPNCLFMNVGSSSPDGYWLTSECSSNRRVVCEYTGDFGETFASTHVLLGQSEDIAQAVECGVPPSVDIDSPFYYYTCAEPRVMASHVFVRKPTQHKDQLIVCELNVFTVNDSLVGVADTMTFETSNELAGTA